MEALDVRTLGFFAKATLGELRRGDPEDRVEHFFVDSRQWSGARAIFVALEGEHFDGHDFLEEIAKKGQTAAIVRRGTRPIEGLTVIEVDDTLEALQACARAWRAHLGTEIIAVTGSNGKTIVKEMLSAVLSRVARVWRSPGSFNSQVGVALALLGLHPRHQWAVIEAGISKLGEMERLEAMIRPDHGLLTNIGDAHTEGLGGAEAKTREKMRLFAHLPANGVLVLPGGESYESIQTLAAWEHPSVRFGADLSTEGVRYTQVRRRDHGGWTFEVEDRHRNLHRFEIAAPGEHNVSNAAAVVAMALELGIEPEQIRQGLRDVEPAPMRLEMHTTPQGVTVINDAYNADFVSARAALMTLEHQAGSSRKIAILGDMLELGEVSWEAHEELGVLAASRGVAHVIAIGSWAKAIAAGVERANQGTSVAIAADVEHARELVSALVERGDTVLFKASRAVGLERVLEQLFESPGPTKLHIDLGAIRRNYHALRARVEGAAIMGVVKSFGYGNDATRVSFELARQGVDSLAVAYADEGVALRRAGLSLPLLVLNTRARSRPKSPHTG